MLKFLFVVSLALLAASPARAVEPWMTLPEAPGLPKADQSGYAPVNGIRIWYASFGKGEPVLFVHGGLANSDWWGNQVRALEGKYRVIVMDSRGHGRSTRNAQGYSYDLMASDVLGLMDFLHLKKVALIGWSDGAIIGLDIAMKHPERLSKLFAFAANYDPAGVADASNSPIAMEFIRRSGVDYARLSPTPKGYAQFSDAIQKMWAREPHWTKLDLDKITVPTWIVDSDHDEMITHDQPRTMADWIPHAGLLILPDASHFGFVQQPREFNFAVEEFLKTR
jgi:pimeloyl-ACP methyl ester carboxylesterase